MGLSEVPPAVSVIIPVFNGGEDIAKCLDGVFASRGVTFECIVVDDASTDGCAEQQAERHGARLIRLEQQRGPAAARNIGAEQARADLLFFTDADVVLHDDALAIATRELQQSPELDAVFGSYDDNPGDPAFLSRYRNLYHHWTHQNARREASTFWSGCGAIRKRVFDQVDGFNADFKRPSIEDIELGYRLRAAGSRINLIHDLLGQHLKRWGFIDMVRTDVFRRGAPWVALLQRFSDAPPDLNLNLKSRVCTVVAGLLALVVAFVLFTRPVELLPFLTLIGACLVCQGLWRGGLAAKSPALIILCCAAVVALPLLLFWSGSGWLAGLPLALTAVLVLLQMTFFRLVTRREGATFACACVPQQIIFFLSCAVSVPIGLLQHWSRP